MTWVENRSVRGRLQASGSIAHGGCLLSVDDERTQGPVLFLSTEHSASGMGQNLSAEQTLSDSMSNSKTK